MSYPSNLDSFLGTTAQGTSPLSSPDHAQDHRTLGSASYALEQKIGVGVSSPTAGKILISTGSGTTSWGTEWDSGAIGTATIGTPLITGGTIKNALLGTNTITGGTIQNALIGTSTITGGTITTVQITRRTIGSAVYSGTVNGTVNLDLSTATRFLVNMPNTAGSVLLIETSGANNLPPNQPFIVEILQGTAGFGTIGWYLGFIKWPDNIIPTLTTTASKKDTFGFIPTSGSRLDGYIIGQNL